MGIGEIFLLAIAVVLPILSLIDLANDRLMKKHQILWTLVIVFVPFFGSVAYLVYSRYVFLFGTKIQ